MKRLVMVLIVVILTSGLAFAGGDKNHGSKGKGNTGGTGNGAVTQNSR